MKGFLKKIFHFHDWVKVDEFYCPSPFDKAKDAGVAPFKVSDSFFISKTTIVFTCWCGKLRGEEFEGVRVPATPEDDDIKVYGKYSEMEDKLSISDVVMTSDERRRLGQ